MNRPKTLELSVSSVMRATLLMIINNVKSFLLRSSKYFKNSIQRKELQWSYKESSQVS